MPHSARFLALTLFIAFAPTTAQSRAQTIKAEGGVKFHHGRSAGDPSEATERSLELSP